MDQTFLPSDYLPVLLQSVVAFGFVAVTMLATHFIGGKRKKFHTVRKDQNFECGIEVKGNARFPFSVKYFLIAILFVLFDVEIIFFYPWAINFKEFGWEGFWKMLLFLGFLLFGFWYIIKKKALDWED
ncbi:MAG TPA: NADH-quinone oxidoreductase subunit A [Bacteroidales bacterium]|nr:NADH-quinone oxidoreductase subunit A [Bacteroidales bacterium]HPS62222.1 NADH-quinone oxidoreductase subunit A [Bacteroidales bacterium]